MKKIIKILSVTVMAIVLLVACASSKEKNIEEFLNKLLSIDTYDHITSVENGTDFVQDCKIVFGDNLTNESFDSLMANRVIGIYKAVLTGKDVKGISNLKISKTSEIKNKEYIHIEYDVTYNLEYNDTTIEMKDKMAFNILDDKPYIINKVSIDTMTSSIYKEFKKIVQ